MFPLSFGFVPNFKGCPWVPGRARAAEPGAGSPAAPESAGPRRFEGLGGPGGVAQRHGAADAESQLHPGWTWGESGESIVRIW